MRERMFSALLGWPLRVPNTGSAGPCGRRSRCSSSAAWSVGLISTVRTPASVFVMSRVIAIRRRAKSRWRPSSRQSSSIRRPASTRTASGAWRGTSLRLRCGPSRQTSPRRTLPISTSLTPSSCARARADRSELRIISTCAQFRPRCARSSAAAASSSAATCSGSRKLRSGRCAMRRRSGSAAGFAPTQPCFCASFRTRARTLICVLMDPFDSGRRRRRRGPDGDCTVS